MKCSEFEKLIYLYRELDDVEKQSLEAHLVTCSSCSAIFDQARKDQVKMSSIVKEVPDKFKNVNPFLTSKIMSGIEQEEERSRVSIIEQFLPVFRFQWLRYAFALMSLVLIAVFIVEVNPVYQTKNVVSFYRRIPIKKTVQLNSSAFGERIKNSPRNNQSGTESFSFAECLNVCKGEVQENNCEECLSRLTKIKSNEGL